MRCREDIRIDLQRARHRLGNFLLRREIYWEAGEAWTRKHRSWLTSIRFSDHASQATLADYLHAHDVLIARRDQVEADLASLAMSAPCAHTVARLRCLRGIDTLTALGLCAEIGEWERFDHPDQLASYLGIVPSEHTTGQQRRLNARWRQLKDARRKPNGIVAVAIARELTGYCWEITTWTGAHPDPVPPARSATPAPSLPGCQPLAEHPLGRPQPLNDLLRRLPTSLHLRAPSSPDDRGARNSHKGVAPKSRGRATRTVAASSLPTTAVEHPLRKGTRPQRPRPGGRVS